MSVYTGVSSGGAIFVWRQSTQTPSGTGTAAPRPRWELRSSGGRTFIFARTPVATSAVVIAATSGNAVANGAQASIYRAVTVSATPGNAAAAGVPAQIITSGAVVITASPGNAAAAGVAARVDQARTVTGNVGNATADGLQATIFSGVTINAGPGNATAAGVQASIRAPLVIVGAAGNAVAAGVQATITEGGSPVYAAIPASRTARGGSASSRPSQLSTGRRR